MQKSRFSDEQVVATLRSGDRDTTAAEVAFAEFGTSPEVRQGQCDRYRGPTRAERPAGGWGYMRGIASIYGETWATPDAVASLRHLNKPGDTMCSS